MLLSRLLLVVSQQQQQHGALLFFCFVYLLMLAITNKFINQANKRCFMLLVLDAVLLLFVCLLTVPDVR